MSLELTRTVYHVQDYHGTNWYASSMLTAVQPWSGYYETDMPVVWATAHITQFTKVRKETYILCPQLAESLAFLWTELYRLGFVLIFIKQVCTYLQILILIFFSMKRCFISCVLTSPCRRQRHCAFSFAFPTTNCS